MDVKIAFVIDVTASMGPWIRAAKEKVVEIIEDLKDQHEGLSFQVGLVAYRDYGDRRPYEISDFTSPEVIQDMLRNIGPHGGDDEAEDVAGALWRAMDLSWGDSGVRIVIHIADAPAHGILYHDATVTDKFPDGDPAGLRPVEMMEQMSDEGICYKFVRITSVTDKMIDVFQSAYKNASNFEVIDLRLNHMSLGAATDLLSPALSRAVSMSITQNTSSQEM